MHYQQLLEQAVVEGRDPDGALGDAAGVIRRLAGNFGASDVPPFYPRPAPLPFEVSDDPHDYVSVATYYWPNPDTPDGLPWVRRDGQFSPHIDDYDRLRLNGAVDSVGVLALAACLDRDRRPAEETLRVLDSWFVAEATRMNPNLNHAQFTPGVDTGRCFGIIDFAVNTPKLLARLRLMLDTFPDLREHKSWIGFSAWCAQLLEWLLTSDLGREEAARPNNHGVFYDLLVIDLASMVGDDDTARRVLEAVPEKRIAPQIEADGSMPHELGRTRSFDYTGMNLFGLMMLADHGPAFGVPLWGEPDDDPAKQPLYRALSFVLDHATPPVDWPYPQIGSVQREKLLPALLIARGAWGNRAPDASRFLATLPPPLDKHPEAILLSPAVHHWHPFRGPGAESVNG